MKITIYGRKGCGSCEKATQYTEALLNNGDVETFEFKDVSIKENVQELYELIGSEVKKIPVIFINGRLGSLENLKALVD